MEVAHPHTGRFLVELEFGNVGFEERGKPECLEKNLSEQRREPTTKLNPHMVSTPGFEPGPHWWEASALTSVPPLLPKEKKRLHAE